jgi:hypothetical protein
MIKKAVRGRRTLTLISLLAFFPAKRKGNVMAAYKQKSCNQNDRFLYSRNRGMDAFTSWLQSLASNLEVPLIKLNAKPASA